MLIFILFILMWKEFIYELLKCWVDLYKVKFFLGEFVFVFLSNKGKL